MYILCMFVFVLLCYVVVFFFFKQKTAYEMRISDWSSDVCSSDLAGKPVGWNADGDRLVNLQAIGRWRGDWQSATGYVALDVVRGAVDKNIYVCELVHTSGKIGRAHV